MSQHLKTSEIDTLRSTIDSLIEQAVQYMDREKGEAPIATLEHYGKTATALFRAANGIMMSQGILYEAYVNRVEWIALRRLARTYNAL